MYKKFFKRFLDIFISLISLIILSPILLIIAILVRINLGSPIVFKQERPGKNEKVFTLYKFRTMTDKKDENGKDLIKRMLNYDPELRISCKEALNHPYFQNNNGNNEEGAI